jgi:histidinol-phosphatase
MSNELEFMHEVVDEASELAMRFFAAGVKVEEKSDQSPVTEADLAVEHLLRTRIVERFPLDSIVGEEFGSTGVAPRTWIVDPIDGTSYFARSDPNWRIHLALQVDDRIEFAVVAAPALGLRWWAQRGQGAFEAIWPMSGRGPRRLQVSGTHLEHSRVACAPDATRDRLPPRCGLAPSSPLPLIELVRGEIDAFVAEGYFLWDHAPWILLVQEAGGRFTDSEGSSFGDRGGGVYSNDALHADLVRSLGYGRSLTL